ncbi:hypothetical protein [Marinobacter sp.]|jgi:hypothetical protein|uniref:hypothetical protein n=1 Tax=Marinobacter sp. TaxID=50741 RepID=UPI002357E88B|nr:hypothetical protein [Marinobacter sp.]|tara:strand:- start:406 stop:732 length:327 start_codon:yes stop_codon:yes gene_type:complete
MTKILETKLPTAIGPLDPEIFNRLVRILELSLGSKDIDATQTVNENQRNLNLFNKGDIIYNLSTDQLQLWTGIQWIDLYVGEEKGVQGNTALGKVSIKTNGATTVPIL